MFRVGLPLSMIACAVLCALAGCELTQRVSLAPPLPTQSATPEVTQDGQIVLRITDGHLANLEGRRVDLPAAQTTFLVHHDGGGTGQEEYDGEPPMAALWLRGRGEARHLLPSLGSSPLRIDTMEDWVIDLLPGMYDLSVTLGAAPPGHPAAAAVLVVR
jgi:hypothetical protein